MSVTGNEPMDPVPHGDDAAPADQPEVGDDTRAEAAGERPGLAEPRDPQAEADFRAAIEPQ